MLGNSCTKEEDPVALVLGKQTLPLFPVVITSYFWSMFDSDMLCSRFESFMETRFLFK